MNWKVSLKVMGPKRSEELINKLMNLKWRGRKKGICNLKKFSDRQINFLLDLCFSYWKKKKQSERIVSTVILFKVNCLSCCRYFFIHKHSIKRYLWFFLCLCNLHLIFHMLSHRLKNFWHGSPVLFLRLTHLQTRDTYDATFHSASSIQKPCKVLSKTGLHYLQRLTPISPLTFEID